MASETYELIITAGDARRACEILAARGAIGLDTETTDLDPYRGQLRLVQISSGDATFVFDLHAFAGDNAELETRRQALRATDALTPLRELLSAPRPVKIAHNAKFDAKWIRLHLGVELGGIFDTLLASQLISAGDSEDRHGLEPVAARYLGTTLDKAAQRSDWSGELSSAQLEYAARDAAILVPLREKQIERLKAQGLVRVAQIEFECVMPLVSLELAGIYLDAACWREQLKKVEHQRIGLADELQELLADGVAQGSLFGRAEINLDSHTQLTSALKNLGVPLPDSTRNWKLQPLAADYPVIAKLLEYRTVQKALTSYGENILEYINPATGRIHADFRQIGAPTGRMACTSPNIQQVPHGDEYRRCFRAPEGRKLIISDYSQIELRILADVTGDQAFIDAFNSGADLHRTTAAQVFKAALEDVTAEQRSFAKRLNFGVVYGIGAQRFSMLTGVAVSEAENIMRRYFQTYRGLDAWLRAAAQRAVRDGESRTLAGRLTRFRFDPQDRQAVSMAQRNGKNSPIQGSSADILKRALHLLHRDLRATSACLVNVVHDEIVVETDASEAEAIAAVVEQNMCAAGAEFVTRVPIKVESEIADEWVK